MMKITQIAQLENELFPDDAWTEDSITDLLAQDINDVITVQQDGQVIGYCLYQIVFETAEILRIGVNPSQQHQGIGTQIFNQLLEIFANKKVENLLLEVRADNKQAINFYQKLGFTQIHTRKGYYKNRDGSATDALIMKLLLPHL